jgi:hypothetical protein
MAAVSLPLSHSWVEAIMTHLIDKNFIERANAVLLLGILCAGRDLRPQRAGLRRRLLAGRLVSSVH